MTKNHFITEADRTFLNKIFQSIKTIFGTDRKQWSCQQILRFLSLLKVQTKLQGFFYQFKISGQLLFDLKYLWNQISKYLQNRTYFPIMKLMYIIKQINFMQGKGYKSKNVFFRCSEPIKRAIQTRTNERRKTNLTNQDLACLSQTNTQAVQQQQVNFTQIISSQKFIQVQSQLIQTLSKQFNLLDQVLFLELSSNQLVKMFKSTGIKKGIQLAELVRIYSIDGYSVAYLLAQRHNLLLQIADYFTFQEITQFQQILNYLLPFYYTQMLSKSKNSAKTSFLKNLQQILPQNSLFDSKKSFRKSQFGTSQYGTSEMGYSEQGKSQYGISEYEESEKSLTKSRVKNQPLRSSYGQSQYQQSQISQSEYAVSQRGSIHHSMEQSYFQNYNQNFVNKQIKSQGKDVRISSVQDFGIIQKLKNVALSLPFNLFKMDPLQNIRITALSYPFFLQFQKPKNHQDFVQSIKRSVQKGRQSSPNSGISKQFNIQGVKFGRSQQNDFRYPDQLSISGKHAQIGFWQKKYQLVDLQSKTGTFLYIPMTRPLILKDQEIIQLSNQIQIIVHILKKDSQQGTIKLQFTKPQNQPFYKASLKPGQTLRLGSSQKCHIKLSQPSISSKHTQIKYQSCQFKIYDCLSSTGTWLRLSKKNVKSQLYGLDQGDIIRISAKRTYLVEGLLNLMDDQDEIQFSQVYNPLNNHQSTNPHNDSNFDQILMNN